MAMWDDVLWDDVLMSELAKTFPFVFDISASPYTFCSYQLHAPLAPPLRDGVEKLVGECHSFAGSLCPTIGDSA